MINAFQVLQNNSIFKKGLKIKMATTPYYKFMNNHFLSGMQSFILPYFR